MGKKVIALILVVAMSLLPMNVMAAQDPSKETVVYKDSRGNEIEVPVNAFATRVVSFTPGTKWTSDKDHVTAENILGAPGGGKNNLCLGKNGVIVLEFSVDIVDYEGMDIYVFEVGPDVEATKVEVSVDMKEWIYVGDAKGALSGVDINGKVPEGARYHYVRITDLGSYPNSNHPGADIEAVAGLNVKSVPFKDIGLDQYYYTPITWAYDNEITYGTKEEIFQPDITCSRGQVVTFLWRIAGKPKPTIKECSFVDVQKGSYYYDAILWAYENDVVAGFTDTCFGPEETVTRGQFLAILHRYKGGAAPTIQMPFVDVDPKIYYAKSVLWGYENGIAYGITPTQFQPDAFCTRAHVVTFLYRLVHME